MPNINPDSYSPLALAFMGDAVYEIMVRNMLVTVANRPAGDLHKMTVRYVCAPAQAAGAAAILPLLDQHELAVYKRGRNAHVSHTPKGATDAQYHAATGLETLFGYLYLSDEKDRLQAIFDAIIKEVDK